jgi:hypothetical protein
MAYDSMILRSPICAGISGSGDWWVAKRLSAGGTKRKPGETQETDGGNVNTGDEGRDRSMAEEGSYYGLLIVVQPKKEAYFLCVFSLFYSIVTTRCVYMIICQQVRNNDCWSVVKNVQLTAAKKIQNRLLCMIYVCMRTAISNLFDSV